MPVVLGLKSGSKFTLDRRYSTSDIYQRINEGRKDSGELMAFDDNRTPSRVIYVDPNEVESIRHDGHNY